MELEQTIPASDAGTPSAITKEQVDAWLAEQAALDNAEDERIYHEVVAWLAERGREIVAVIQPINGGVGAVAVWGVQKKRGS